MDPTRPDPDELLMRLAPESLQRGILKVFLGYAAGVGKSFAMLQAANAALSQGRDVVVGWIEPHARPETILLLTGMESIANRKASVGSLQVLDLDLDACLARRPEVLLVDELAHTNAPGSRHLKRWQDVEELLEAGIEVWTTINVQHLDSMNDVVARVTGVKVQETIPDSVIDQAAEVEVVDVAPEDLIDRLEQGKIYPPEQARRALGSFFRKENLLVLRELTLRRAAERVGKEVDSARAGKRVEAIWPVRERLLVSVGPSPLSEDLLRQASRLARSLDAELLAVSIETPSGGVRDAQAQARLAKNLGVAESLGAETVVLQGEEVARDLVAYARKRNVTKLVVGKNRGHRWPWKRTIGDELLRISGDIDVYVLSGRPSPQDPPPAGARPTWVRWPEVLWSTAIVAGFTVLATLFKREGMVEANIVLTLLMSVVFSASLFGLGASVFASCLTVLSFNFFFVHPIYSFAVDDPQYYLVFVFLLVVGAVVGTLTQRLKLGVQAARDREQRVETLNRMHRQLASLVEPAEVRAIASALVGEILDGPVRIVQKQPDGTWLGADGPSSPDIALFDWAFDHGQRAGRGTGTLFDHRLSVWPLNGSGRTLGLLVVDQPVFRTEWIESLAALVASALERVELIESARIRDRLVETERTRNALLHSLSHDLRTPLTIIAGSLETLEGSSESQWSPRDRQLMESVRQETWDLGRQVDNLLELSRLTERGLSWTLAPVPVEEPLCSAVDRFRGLHPGCRVSLELPSGEPLAVMEPRLVERALANYLDNAWEYAGGVDLVASVVTSPGTVCYTVADRGPGVLPGDKEVIFEKFVRGTQGKTSGRRGTGIGLAIVAEVARIHHGTATVDDRPGGGALFSLQFPRGES